VFADVSEELSASTGKYHSTLRYILQGQGSKKSTIDFILNEVGMLRNK
jgi:hypothetical protein